MLVGVVMNNNANDYDGVTTFSNGGTFGFTSIGNIGEASSLGAPTTAANGLVVVTAGRGFAGTLEYRGAGNTSDRDWRFTNTANAGTYLTNAGTGALVLTGNIATDGPGNLSHRFRVASGDMQLLGAISSTTNRPFFYEGAAGHSITLGGANTYAGASTINTITVYAPSWPTPAAAAPLARAPRALSISSTARCSIPARERARTVSSPSTAPASSPTTAPARSRSAAPRRLSPVAPTRSRSAAAMPAPTRSAVCFQAPAAWS